MNKFKIRQFLFITLLTLCIILSSGYALSTTNIYYYYFEIFTAYIMMFKIVIHFKNNKTSYFDYIFLSTLFMISIPFFIHGGENLIVYTSYIFKVVIAFGIVITYNFNDFSNLYRKIILTISIISLFGYYLVNIQKSSFMQSLPEFLNLNNVPYQGLYLFFYIPWIPERNLGIFWEPGLFATFLIIGLLFELFFNNKKISIFRVIVFSITIFTTQSSAGYLLLFIISIAFFIHFLIEKIVFFKKYFSIYFLIATCILLINFQNIIYSLNLDGNKTLSKLIGSNLMEQSRLSAPFHNFEMFLNSPFFGNSIKVVFDNIDFVADTSTSSFALSVFGIFGVQYTLFWIYGLTKKSEILIADSIPVKFMILLVFLIILNKEPHLGILFSWCIMFYLVNSKKEAHKFNKGYDHG